MADESDVGNALVALIAGAVYPKGTSQPPVTGYPTTIKRGWPLPSELDTAFKRDQIVISIFGQNGTEKNVTRFSRDWHELTAATETITATLVGNTLTIGGTVGPPQNIMVLVGSSSDAITRRSVSYAVQTSDTLTSIATAITALLVIAGDSCTSSGATITFSASDMVEARLGGWGTVIREIKRQERRFQITLWCNSPAQRDQASPIIDLALSLPESLRYSDGTVGRMLYERTMVLDEKQAAEIYRRDFIYCLEYPTIQTMTAPKILTVETTLEVD